jgi:hypothetical protein
MMAAGLVLACALSANLAVADPAPSGPPPPPPLPIPVPPPIPIPPVTIPIPTAEQEQALVQAALNESQDSYFPQCDGYGPPTAAGDGMTKWALTLGILSLGGGNTRRTTPTFAEPHGIGACGAALSDLGKYPQYWMRKVSLLRARAIHRLEIDDSAGALKDLDAADAAAVDKDDVYYQRSLKLGLDLVRAYALRVAGDASKSEALAMQAWASRPYSAEAAYAAVIVLGPDAPGNDADQILRATSQSLPEAADRLFDTAFEHGRFDEAVTLYPGIAPVPRVGNIPMAFRDAVQLKQTNRALDENFWATESGRYAYALAALGRPGDARAAIQAEHDRFAASTPADPPLAQGASVQAMTEYAVHEQANLEIKTLVGPVVATWARVVEARCAVDEGRIEETWAEFAVPGGPKGPVSWAMVDLANAIAAKSPAHALGASRMELGIEKGRRAPRAAELKALFVTLPETETRERVAPYRPDRSWRWAGGVAENGFALTEHPDQGSTTISFRGRNAPAATLEDLSLLKAADMARQAGKKGVVVLGRRSINHIITTTMYGQAIASRPDGYEIQLDVMLVDPASPPAAYKDAPWRIMDADAAYAALAPIYLAPNP